MNDINPNNSNVINLIIQTEPSKEWTPLDVMEYINKFGHEITTCNDYFKAGKIVQNTAVLSLKRLVVNSPDERVYISVDVKYDNLNSNLLDSFIYNSIQDVFRAERLVHTFVYSDNTCVDIDLKVIE